MGHSSSGSAPDGTGASLDAKVAFLSTAATYPDVSEVEVRQTHMAWVFLAGDRVYKLKKPVRHPFLDYSTLDARRRVCEDEVRLNRRLAPDVYLGVSRLTVEPDGALAIDGAGTITDWLVAMRRLPAQRMLDAAIRSGAVTPAAVGAVAAHLGNFYRDADPVEIDPGGYVERFAAGLRENRALFQIERFNATAGLGDTISRELESLLQRRPGIVTDRLRAGKIVEGHGDLRPEHVCLIDPPVIIDCLEFSRDLRLVDPFEDLSYLALECAVLGARWIGTTVLERCAAILDDHPGDRVLAFYTAFRACLRARQALAHLLEAKPRTPEKWIPLAGRYLAEAEQAAVTLGLPAARPATGSRGGAG